MGEPIFPAEASTRPRILNTVEVARDAAIWRQQHDAAGVREEIGLSVKGVAEIGSFGHRVNGFLRARQEMPAGIGFRPAEMAKHFLFLFRGHFRSFA